MDIDRFIVLHEAEWLRLGELARGAGRSGRNLTGTDIDELVPLYQRASLHLSQARTTYRDPELVRRLSAVVAAAHAAIYGAHVARLSAVRRFLWWTFPAAIYTCRRQIWVAAFVFWGAIIGLGLFFWLAPGRINLAMPASIQHEYLGRDFTSYYSQNHSFVFFSEVTTNNIKVSINAFVLGAMGGFPGGLVLLGNGIELGEVAGLYAQHGRFWNTFMVYLAPHGLMELTAITVSAGAGFRIGWHLFAPGDRSRTRALTDEGQRCGTIILGCMLMFLTAGTIEGFVTGAPAIPAAVKVAIGISVWVGFLAYAVVRGRKAAAAGFTGSLEELRPTWVPPQEFTGAALHQGPRAFAADPLAADGAAGTGTGDGPDRAAADGSDAARPVEAEPRA